MATITINY